MQNLLKFHAFILLAGLALGQGTVVSGPTILAQNTVLFGGAASVGGTITFIQHSTTDCNSSSAVTTCTVIFTSNVATGNLVVIPYSEFSASGTVASATDTTSANTYVVSDFSINITGIGTGNHTGFVYSIIGTGGFTTVTLTFPVGAAISAHGLEFHDAGGVFIFDKATNNSNAVAGTSSTTATLTPAASNELFVAVQVASSNPTQTLTSVGWSSEGFGTGVGYGQSGAAYIIGSGSTAQTATWTLGTSQTYANRIAAFKP